MHMADWEHKERRWSDHYYSNLEGDQIQNRNFVSSKGNPRSFTEWLDWQCKGGWEVIKISRNFSDARSGTWCVFRRKN